MARPRRAKLRAQRIERGYYLRPHIIRWGRAVLFLLALAAAAVWVWPVVMNQPSARQAGSPGRMSAAHAMLEDRCEACHGGSERFGVMQASAGDNLIAMFRQGPSDGACQACHGIPDHNPNQVLSPSCNGCHVEHRAAADLSAVAAPACTTCHADLAAQTKGAPAFVRGAALHLAEFADEPGHAVHPEFAVWTGTPEHPKREPLDALLPPHDMAQLRLNHALHLKPIAAPPGNQLVELVCGDCHWGSAHARTPRFGTPAPGLPPPTSPELTPAEEAAYMAPVTYRQHCSGCHGHNFADVRLPAVFVPHDTPEVVHAFLVGVYTDRIARHPEDLMGTPRLRPIAYGAIATSARTSAEWVAREVKYAEDFLFGDPPRKRCRQCHEFTEPPGSLPIVAPTRVPIRWFPQSRFDHGVHRLLECSACHAADQSTVTPDVLMPRVDSCAACHHPQGARTACAECHTYHAAIGPDAMSGRFGLQTLSAGN